MPIVIQNLDLNNDLSADQIATIKGGATVASTLTSSFSRESTAFSGALAASSPGNAGTLTSAGVETDPGGVGVAVSFAFAASTPSLSDLRSSLV